MKLFTITELQDLKPCHEGYAWYRDNIKTEIPLEILLQLNIEHPSWSRWLMVRLLTKEQNQKLALFAAEQVLLIFEKKYPNDKRPRECIGAAYLYLEGKITREDLLVKRRAAYVAAYAAADAATCDAYAAADAATCDAYAAADAATCDAYADAAVAAYNAACAAAAADARKEMQEIIIRHAVELMESEK